MPLPVWIHWVRIQMRPRASQVAKTRLVETEEDVETVHEDDDLSVSVHWPDRPHPRQGVGKDSRG